MSVQIVDEGSKKYNVVHFPVSAPHVSAHAQLNQDRFEISRTAGKPAPVDLKDLFELAHKRAAGSVLQWFMAGLQLLGLFLDAVKELKIPGGAEAVDENAAPIEAFVEAAARMAKQIEACTDEASIDALLEQLERDTWNMPPSKRVQFSLAQVRLAGRAAKFGIVEARHGREEAEARAKSEQRQSEMQTLQKNFEALSEPERRRQQEHFNHDYARARQRAEEQTRREDEITRRNSEEAAKQRAMLGNAHEAAHAAQGAADEAAVKHNAGMPSATSKMPHVSRNSRPSPTASASISSRLDPGEVVTFISVVMRALPELRQVGNKDAMRRVLRDNDIYGTVDTMTSRAREVCLKKLWQELQGASDLRQLAENLLAL